MRNLVRLTPWFNRLALAAPLMIFTLLTVRIIADPVHSAADHGMSLDSAVGLTNFRAGNGGVFLACAVITLVCLVSRSRHLMGLSFVAIMMGVILALRFFSAIADGDVREQMPLLAAETVFLTLSVSGIVLERTRLRPDHAIGVTTENSTEARGY